MHLGDHSSHSSLEDAANPAEGAENDYISHCFPSPILWQQSLHFAQMGYQSPERGSDISKVLEAHFTLQTQPQICIRTGLRVDRAATPPGLRVGCAQVEEHLPQQL